MLLLYIFVSLLARWRFQLAILDGCKIKFHEKVFIAYEKENTCCHLGDIKFWENTGSDGSVHLRCCRRMHVQGFFRTAGTCKVKDSGWL